MSAISLTPYLGAAPTACDACPGGGAKGLKGAEEDFGGGFQFRNRRNSQVSVFAEQAFAERAGRVAARTRIHGKRPQKSTRKLPLQSLTLHYLLRKFSNFMQKPGFEI